MRRAGAFQGEAPLEDEGKSVTRAGTRTETLAAAGGEALMVPVLDSIDHCSSPEGSTVESLAHNVWFIEGHGQHGAGGMRMETGERVGYAVVLVAGQPYRRGQEICHSYSRSLSASTYLLRYGFIPRQTRGRVWLPLGGFPAGMEEASGSRGSDAKEEGAGARRLRALTRHRVAALARSTGLAHLLELESSVGLWAWVDSVSSSAVMCWLRIDVAGVDYMSRICAEEQGLNASIKGGAGEGGGETEAPSLSGVAASSASVGGSESAAQFVGGAGWWGGGEDGWRQGGAEQRGKCCLGELPDAGAEQRAWVRLRVISLAMARYLQQPLPPQPTLTSDQDQRRASLAGALRASAAAAWDAVGAAAKRRIRALARARQRRSSMQEEREQEDRRDDSYVS